MNTLPQEIHVFIASLLDYKDFNNYVEAFNLTLTYNDYFQLMTYNFPMLIHPDIKNYDIKDIYYEFLYLHPFVESWKESTMEVHNYITCLRIHFNNNPFNNSCSQNLYKYILINNFIEWSTHRISMLDNVEIFQHFRNNINDKEYSSFIANNSKNIIKYLLNEKYIFHYDTILSLYRYSDPSLLITKLLLAEYNYTSEQLLRLVLINKRSDNIEYMLSMVDFDKIDFYANCDITEYNTTKFDVKSINFYGHDIVDISWHIAKYSSLIHTHEKFKHLITDNDIVKLYNKMIRDIRNHTFEQLKSITILATHPAIRKEYLKEYLLQ